MNRSSLKLVPDQPEPQPDLSYEASLRELIARRDRALKDAADAERQMRPLMRRFADARGERMMPTVERLRRELESSNGE